MLNNQRVQEYWQEQTKRGENHATTHDEWQDEIRIQIRTSIDKKGDVEEAEADSRCCCGIGDYTRQFFCKCAPRNSSAF